MSTFTQQCSCYMIKTTQADKTERKRTIKYAKHKTHTRVSVPLSAICHFWRSFCRSATCRIHWCKGAREPVVEHRADRHEHLHPNPEQQRDWRTHRHGRPQEKGQKRAAALPEIFHKVRLLMLSRQLNKLYLFLICQTARWGLLRQCGWRGFSWKITHLRLSPSNALRLELFWTSLYFTIIILSTSQGLACSPGNGRRSTAVWEASQILDEEDPGNDILQEKLYCHQSGAALWKWAIEKGDWRPGTAGLQLIVQWKIFCLRAHWPGWDWVLEDQNVPPHFVGRTGDNGVDLLLLRIF